MVNTVKFSDFNVADINDSTTQDVGLSSGVNTRENKFYNWTTGTRPATPFNGLLGLNTTLQQYEFWDSVAGIWTQFADSDFFAVLASHTAGQGASLIGLQNQSNVTNKFVQDLANATFIAQTSNGSLQNAQYLGSLTTGIVKNTTVTGVLSISAPLTSIDGLTTVLGDILYVSAPNTYVNLAGNITSAKQFLSQTGTGVISAAPAWSTVSAGDIVSPAALTKTDDTNITLTLGGSPTVALLAATSLTLGWTGQLAVGRGGTGNSTFTAYSVLCAGTTATGAFQNVSGVGTANQVLVSNGAGALPSWQTVPGLAPSALTKTDDTNVTLTLGGSPTVALLAATSLTLGWTGQLGLTRGGTNASLTASNGGILYSTASALAILGGTATANLPLLSGSSTAPSWSSFALNLGGALTTAAAFTMSGAFAFTGTLTGITGVTFPTSGTLATTSQLPSASALTKTDDTNVTLTLGGSPTVALLAATSLTLGWTGQLSVARGGTGLATITAHDLIIGNGTSAPNLLAPSATSGVPLISQGASADPVYGTAVVGGGGTGITSATAYAVLCGGTTSTNPFQSVASVGTSGQVLTSNGAGALPTFQTATGTGTVSSGSINQLAWYAANGTTVSGLATANSGVLVTSSGGVPSISSTLPAFTTSSITFNPTTGGIVGTTTNDNAAAGKVGEFVSSVIVSGSAVALTSATAKDVTSISLTAGDWDVWGNVGYPGNGVTTIGETRSWTSLTSATSPDLSLYVGENNTSTAPAASRGYSVPSQRYSLSGTTTIYLSAYAAFAGGSQGACGGIYARRAR